MIKSVAIGQRWRRKSTSHVYSVYMVWRKDRRLWLKPCGPPIGEGVVVTVDELKRKFEPVDMYIDPALMEKNGPTPEG